MLALYLMFLRRSAVVGPHGTVKGGEFENPEYVAWSTSSHIVARSDGCVGVRGRCSLLFACRAAAAG